MPVDEQVALEVEFEFEHAPVAAGAEGAGAGSVAGAVWRGQGTAGFGFVLAERPDPTRGHGVADAFPAA